MREKRLILDGSPCDTNLYSDGPTTVNQARSLGRSFCPHRGTCSQNFLGPSLHQCVMQTGTEVAQWAIKEGTTIPKEMKEFQTAPASRPPKGWVYSPDRKNFVIITDNDDAHKKVAEFAHIVLGFDTSQPGVPPQAIGDSFESVLAHATTPAGFIDVRRMEELEGRFGSNGGRGCDVRRGPCSCGATH